MDQILQKLEYAFPGADIELKNTSSMHVGHNAKGMHLKTIISYRGFKGKSLIEQHRMVQKALEHLGLCSNKPFRSHITTFRIKKICK